MILVSLQMENFRQFYGKQTIEFARGSDGKNVTVIHGFNGAGKTALLNAFVWCLYKQTTPDFGSPERLESERALAELTAGAALQVKVLLRYELRGEEYLVERVQKVSRSVDEVVRHDPELKMWQFVSGELVAPAGDEFQRQQRINQMLPVGLYQFFFFNGERVEWLAKKEASRDVEKGIKTFLDVEIYERSVKRLRKEVAPELASVLKSVGTAELTVALDEESALKNSEEELQDKQELLEQNIGKTRDDIATIEARQASIQALYDLAQKRDNLKALLNRCERERTETENRLSRVLSDDGYLAFSDSVLAAAMKLIDSARDRGELPAQVKPQFVSDLLDRHVCICGRNLDPSHDKAEVDCLLQWRDKVGLAALEESISKTGGAVPGLRKRREKCAEEVSRIQVERDRLFSERRNLQDQLASVQDQMGDKDHGEDAQALKRQLDGLRATEVTALADLKTVQGKLDEIKVRIQEVAHKIKSLTVQKGRAELIKTQKESVERIANALEEIFEIQKQDVRQYLSAQVQHIWNDASIKPYDASVLENFSLCLTKSVNGASQVVHGASTGEKQVLALSFVGSLVKKAKENLDANRGASFAVGGEYPLVMDSPFGSLEDDYRAKVAQWIPKLAHQVVMMVSKTQWRDEVETNTRARIGREYVLELRTQKQGADRKISIAGQDYPYVVETHDPVEQTIVREVD